MGWLEGWNCITAYVWRAECPTTMQQEVSKLPGISDSGQLLRIPVTVGEQPIASDAIPDVSEGYWCPKGRKHNPNMILLKAILPVLENIDKVWTPNWSKQDVCVKNPIWPGNDLTWSSCILFLVICCTLFISMIFVTALYPENLCTLPVHIL